MTDIVERLRSCASDDHERGCQGRCYDCSCGYDAKRDPLLNEAADTIERLRAALKRMLLEFDFMVENGVIPDVRNDIIFVYARAALGGDA